MSQFTPLRPISSMHGPFQTLREGENDLNMACSLPETGVVVMTTVLAGRGGGNRCMRHIPFRTPLDMKNRRGGLALLGALPGLSTL